MGYFNQNSSLPRPPLKLRTVAPLLLPEVQRYTPQKHHHFQKELVKLPNSLRTAGQSPKRKEQNQSFKWHMHLPAKKTCVSVGEQVATQDYPVSSINSTTAGDIVLNFRIFPPNRTPGSPFILKGNPLTQN
eukprot:TRINITY_DN43103_c0_g1_i1.p2 TRINITY_DN43103_c0_g1~~TRINITY_DN43103_c0_g1_i1.p2  ORF type:complete len:131 (+),score=7.10 TRINITY_DN43103_c0_g1_i1:392-784(+)